MKRLTSQLFAFWATATALVACPTAYVVAQQVPEFDIQSIGTVSPNSPNDSWATDINNQGIVAGTSFYTNTMGFTSLRPVRWSDAGLTPLMTFGSGSLTSINDAADCVGFKLGSGGKAHIWDAQGGHADLHYGSLRTSTASDISGMGEVIGSYDYLDVNPVDVRRGFYRDLAGNYQTMPSLGGQGSSAASINALGQIVGLAEDINNVRRAASWNPGFGVQDLGIGGEFSSTAAINDRGQIIGIWMDAHDHLHGYLLDQGSIIDIPALMPTESPVPADINQAGIIVGGSSTVGLSGHAVLWDRQQNIVDLQTLIPASSGWDLEIATGINDLGEISGWGYFNGIRRGFRLTPKSNLPRISGAQPAVAGASNSKIFAAGFEPQAVVHYFWGTQRGRTSAFGYYLDIADPHWIGQSLADDFGRSELATSIPLSLIGRRILTQAVDLTSGKPSFLIEQRVL